MHYAIYVYVRFDKWFPWVLTNRVAAYNRAQTAACRHVPVIYDRTYDQQCVPRVPDGAARIGRCAVSIASRRQTMQRYFKGVRFSS